MSRILPFTPAGALVSVFAVAEAMQNRAGGLRGQD